MLGTKSIRSFTRRRNLSAAISGRAKSTCTPRPQKLFPSLQNRPVEGITQLRDLKGPATLSTSSKPMSTTSTRRAPDFERPRAAAVPYSGPALHGVADDLVINSVLHLNEDERYWVPQLDNVWYRPLLFSLSQGYWVNLLRVRRSGILSRHRHTGPVHAATLKGKWHYLEHDWWATAGSYSYEPPGDIHTLEVPEGVEEMVTLFHVTGSYTYVEPDGTPIGNEDVFSQFETARDHYIKNGIGEDYVNSLVR